MSAPDDTAFLPGASAGCSRLQVLRHAIVPLALPGIGAAFITRLDIVDPITTREV